MKKEHWSEQLAVAVKSLDREDPVPKGYFCHEDLLKSGLKGSKASRLVRRLKAASKVHCLKLKRRDRGGILQVRPFYRILP